MTEFELGNNAYLSGDFQKAKEHYLNAIQESSVNLIVYHNLGLTCAKLNQSEEAIRYLEIPTRYNYSDSFTTRGAVKRNLGDYDGALVDFLKSLRADPNNPSANSNYGNSLRELGLPELAVPFFQRAQELDDNPQHRLNESVAHLLNGDWIEGWKKYDARWYYESDKSTKPVLPGEEYDGTQDIQGKIILVYGEQGFGDVIQFSRFVKVLQAQGAFIILAVRKPLVELIQHSFPTVKVIDSSGDIPGYHHHVPLMELPKIINLTPDNIPLESKFLDVPEEIISKYKTALADVKKPKIGIVWSSNRDAYIGRFKRIDLQEMLSGIHSDNFEWVSLYIESTPEELRTLESYNIRKFDSELTNFAETAGLVSNLDLVITIDTAVAHLAGGLGVKTWLMLPNYAVDWRWLLKRNDSPFYPSMKIYRQDTSNTWLNVLQSIKNDLSSFG